MLDEDLRRSHDQQVDLIPAAVLGMESEVRPGAEGLTVRKALPNESSLLVRELGLSDPSGRHASQSERKKAYARQPLTGRRRRLRLLPSTTELQSRMRADARLSHAGKELLERQLDLRCRLRDEPGDLVGVVGVSATQLVPDELDAVRSAARAFEFGPFEVEGVAGVEELQALLDGTIRAVKMAGLSRGDRQFAGGVLELDDGSLGDVGRPGDGHVPEGLTADELEHTRETRRTTLRELMVDFITSLDGFTADEEAAVDGLTRAPKVVFSAALDGALTWAITTLVRDDAVAAVRAMKQDGSGLLSTTGSISLCRSLPGAGLVDRFRVVLFPVITGVTGAERIYDGYPDVALEMTDHRTFDGRIQLVEYRPRVLEHPPLGPDRMRPRRASDH